MIYHKGSVALTTLVTFYKLNIELLWDNDLASSFGVKSTAKGHNASKTPTDEEVEELYQYCARIWDALLLTLEDLHEDFILYEKS